MRGTRGATLVAMAAIDSLLRVMALRDAEAMVISTGQVPALRRAGQAEPMAMPALDPVMVMAFVDELVPASRRAELDERAVELTHRPAGGDPVAISVERTGSGYRLLVRRGARSLTPGANALPSRPAIAIPPVGAPTTYPPPPSPPPMPAGPAIPIATAAPVAVPAPEPIIATAMPTGEYAIPAPSPSRTRTPRSGPIPIETRSPGSAPHGGLIASLVTGAAERGASDLLLSAGLAPRLRIDGSLVELGFEPTSDDEVRGVIQALAGGDAVRTLEARGAVDFGATVAGQRLRGHGFAHERGLALALRLIRADVPTMAGLGLPDDLAALVQLRSGLVLVGGPAGSGKSTTLVALIAHLNRTRPRHIITLEDPIEYLHTPERCAIHQREIGRHAPSFADGLRAALREAPDVIVVGELRDRDTITIALTAAETGHLVLGTVHAPGAAVAIDRLIDAYPEHAQGQARNQLAAVLRCVVTQYLVPARSGGRAVAIEKVPATPAVGALIRKNELQMLATHIQLGRDAGMIPLEKSLAALVRGKLVEPAAARAVALDLDYFEQALRA